MIDKRINIFTGHFGSGKTEISVNFAANLIKEGLKTAIVDLDIVNPYFRTAVVQKKMEKAGVRVIVPRYANTNVDIPALPAEINSLFEDKSLWVVFDTGGDDIGAKALGRYKSEIVENGYDMYVVVNTNRPFTDTKEKIIKMISDIEEASRLRATKLVNNTHLLGETKIDQIIKGNELVMEVSESIGIPVGFTAYMPKNSDDAEIMRQDFDKILLLDKMIKLPWE
ncbi:MAG TPA: hypothetical protein GXX49_08010 [Clostridiaceae bacterium]|nr:hypothetical protein [Clostridiaceae bacterium]